MNFQLKTKSRLMDKMIFSNIITVFKKNLLRMTFICFLLTLYSCEYEAQISYKISNESSTKIKVVFNDNGISNDTVYIDIDTTETIAIHGQGLSSVDNYKENSVKLSEFFLLEIYKHDTIRTQTDFSETKNWVWYGKDVHSAEYTATINNNDFQLK